MQSERILYDCGSSLYRREFSHYFVYRPLFIAGRNFCSGFPFCIVRQSTQANSHIYIMPAPFGFQTYLRRKLLTVKVDEISIFTHKAFLCCYIFRIYRYTVEQRTRSLRQELVIKLGSADFTLCVPGTKISFQNMD